MIKCPSCKRVMKLCENTKCTSAPHFICSDYEGCMYSRATTSKEILALKFEHAK